jgi:DNA-binding protein HU-beta
MNKNDLVDAVARRCDLSKAKAWEAVEAIFSSQPGMGIIASALAHGEKVTLPGFGTLAMRARPSRVGRNPKTGARIVIRAGTRVTFRPGRVLSGRLAGPAEELDEDSDEELGEGEAVAVSFEPPPEPPWA